MEPFPRLTGNIKVLSGALAVLALALFVPFATNLVQQRTSVSPQANIETTAAQSSITLSQHQFNCTTGDPVNGIPPAADCNVPAVNRTFAVDVLVHADIDPANLVNVQVNYDPTLLTVEKIVSQSQTTQAKATGSTAKKAADFFVESWLVREFDNQQGTVRLNGAVPSPGFITSQSDTPPTMARIYFKPKRAGTAVISIEDNAAIYRNADNSNILNNTNPLTLTIN